MVARISKFTRYVSYQKEMAPPARRQCTAVLPDRIGLPNGATISRTALVLPSDFSIEENDKASLRREVAIFPATHPQFISVEKAYGNAPFAFTFALRLP